MQMLDSISRSWDKEIASYKNRLIVVHLLILIFHNAWSKIKI